MDNNIRELALAAVTGKVTNFTQEDAEYALREEIKKVAGSMKNYQQNKWDLFEIIQQTAEIIIPNRIISIFGQFADVQQVGQGNKAQFKRKLGKRRGKSFVTKVSPAGTYEAFRLDSETVEIPTEAVGAAAIIDWERYLDGLDDMSDLIDIIMEGIEDAVYRAVYAQLIAAYTNVKMPAGNKATASGFDKTAMDRLIAVVRSYGDNCVIFCSPLFARNVDNEVKGSYMSLADRDEIRTQGYVGIYHGVPLVVLPLSTKTEANLEWAYDPSYAFIMPAGKEKVVKLVFEGELQINDWINKDWSMEMQFYKKFGVGMLYFNNWAIYKDTSLHVEVQSM